MKRTITFIIPILLLVVFPLLSSGAFADFIGNSSHPITIMFEPVNMLLFGIGIMFASNRV